MQTILALLLTLGILVTVHEFGHFWVARRCGVKVLKFSVGFGPALFSWKDKQDTQYALAAIPLGGYVKMLDEREAEVPDAQLHMAFNRKSVWQRIAVVSAGPIANFLFAIFAFWLMFVTGVTGLAPTLGEIEKGSISDLAGLNKGDEILSIDGHKVANWQDANLALVRRIGETGVIEVEVQPQGSSANISRKLNINQWMTDEENPNPFKSLGFSIWRPTVIPELGQISEDGRAKEAGLRPGDVLISVDGQVIDDWSNWVKTIQQNPEVTLAIEILRGDERLQVSLTPKEKYDEKGNRQGYIGAGVVAPKWPESMIRHNTLGPIDALGAGLAKTWDMTTLTLESIGKMINGLLSVKNLSGPITIAKVAGASVEGGFEAFLAFLAYLSISLGVLNLLPIPVLDGGHLLFYIIEAIKGSPVPEKVQMIGFQFGMMLILGIMALAIFNDISRL